MDKVEVCVGCVPWLCSTVGLVISPEMVRVLVVECILTNDSMFGSLLSLLVQLCFFFLSNRQPANVISLFKGQTLCIVLLCVGSRFAFLCYFHVHCATEVIAISTIVPYIGIYFQWRTTNIIHKLCSVL